MAKCDVTTISERSDMVDIPDLEEIFLQAVRERLRAMTDSELDALFAGLPGNSIGPGMASCDLDRLMETMWYLHHVHQNVRDD